MRRQITITEDSTIPMRSIVLGFGPMALIAIGAAVAGFSEGVVSTRAAHLTIVWAAVILAFLSGVRRGLSFRTEGGPTAAQLATMLVYFVLALTSLVVLAWGVQWSAILPLLVGYAGAAFADPSAARAGEAPLFFARLRPAQMAVGATSLCALLLVVYHSGPR